MNLFKRRSKMRFYKGDKVKLAKDAGFPGGSTIKKGTVVEIISRDLLFRTYDIDHEGVEYTDFDDTDFEPVK